ncbi:MAG: YkgJ family cysteine cluster protein [Methanomicrobiales archaeon]|nr:YkgJ family cysteine cluster protein [Methanomicrobiales archaeon]
MVRFVCSRCGKCCMSFGRYISPERDLGGGRMQCRNQLDGEIFIAAIEEGRDLFALERGRPPRNPRWCRFLHYTPAEGMYTCMIYRTRPRFCREYRCTRLVVMDGAGNKAGKMVGKTGLVTEDEQLSRIWEMQVKPILLKERDGSMEEIRKKLEEAGYQVLLYE